MERQPKTSQAAKTAKAINNPKQAALLFEQQWESARGYQRPQLTRFQLSRMPRRKHG